MDQVLFMQYGYCFKKCTRYPPLPLSRNANYSCHSYQEYGYHVALTVTVQY